MVCNRIATFGDFFNRSAAVGNVNLVATDNDKVIGYVSGGVPESPECAQDTELGGLYINPDYIGHGVGKILVQAFAQEMKKRGAQTFGLMCFSDNPSMKFYKHMGGIITVERDSGARYEYARGAFLEFNIADVLSK